AALAKRSRNLREAGPRDIERQMLHAADLSRGRSPGIRAGFVGKHREQPAVARVEIEMVLIGLAEIRLLQNEGHSQQALPEVHRTLPGRTDNGDVMNPLHLQSLHTCLLIEMC